MALKMKCEKKPAFDGSFGFRCSKEDEKKMKETYKKVFDFPDFFRQKTAEAIREAETIIKELGLDLKGAELPEEIPSKLPSTQRLP